MLKTLNKMLILALFLGVTFMYGQDDADDTHLITLIIPQVALLDIESAAGNDINLQFTAPTEAGEALAEQTDNSLWLNVTSIVAAGNTRDINVKVDNTYDGIDLKVVAGAYSGLGFGNFGTPSAELTLTNADQALVTGITSGYTADGVTNGYQLSYTAEMDDAAVADLLSNGAGTDITVTYTLTN